MIKAPLPHEALAAADAYTSNIPGRARLTATKSVDRHRVCKQMAGHILLARQPRREACSSPRFGTRHLLASLGLQTWWRGCLELATTWLVPEFSCMRVSQRRNTNCYGTVQSPVAALILCAGKSHQSTHKWHV